MTFDKIDFNNISAGAEVWEKVIRKVRAGMMPPQGVPRPDQASSERLVASLETALDRTAVAKPNPGRSLLHRVNRAEYANLIRDLLALDIDAASLLPPDDAGYGFDNIADLLGVSPVLLERYLSAAMKVGPLAIGDMETGPVESTYRAPADLNQLQHVGGSCSGRAAACWFGTTFLSTVNTSLRRRFGGTTRVACADWRPRIRWRSRLMARAST